MSFLQLDGKAVLVFGVANKKSVAYHIGQVLRDNGAIPVFSVRSEARAETCRQLFPGCDVFVCDVEREAEIARLRDAVTARHPRLHGIVHSIAFANYSAGWKPFHETQAKDFLQSVQVSCFSLVQIANAFKAALDPDGAVVAISISTTRMAAENYGYMAPVKAALDSSIAFLAKSFSEFSRVRFNTVNPGLLKTSASAGIPSYLESYLYAEQATLRKKGVETREAANAAVFLLSPAASGINAQHLVIDAGMGVNYFDNAIVKKATKG